MLNGGTTADAAQVRPSQAISSIGPIADSPARLRVTLTGVQRPNGVTRPTPVIATPESSLDAIPPSLPATIRGRRRVYGRDRHKSTPNTRDIRRTYFRS